MLIKKKRLIFKNQVYKVYSNYIKSKDYTVKDYLSLEVEGKKFGGVCSVIQNNKKIALMDVYSPISKKKIFSLVQGFCNKNENSINAIRREILEETGINVRKQDIKYLNKIFPMHSLINAKLACFHVQLKKINNSDFKRREKEIGSGKINFYNISQIKKMLKKPYNFDLISYALISYFLIERKII